MAFTKKVQYILIFHVIFESILVPTFNNSNMCILWIFAHGQTNVTIHFHFIFNIRDLETLLISSLRILSFMYLLIYLNMPSKKSHIPTMVCYENPTF